MFFRRKGYLRKEFDEKFLEELQQLKNEWIQQKEIVEKSFEPSEEIISHVHLAEAKYFYAIKEAKRRQIKVLKS